MPRRKDIQARIRSWRIRRACEALLDAEHEYEMWVSPQKWRGTSPSRDRRARKRIERLRRKVERLNERKPASKEGGTSAVTISVVFDNAKLRDYVLSLYDGPEYDDPYPDDPLDILDGWADEFRAALKQEHGLPDTAWMVGNEAIERVAVETSRCPE